MDNIDKILRYTPATIVGPIIDVLKAKRVPFVKSSPGMGKSDIIKNIADEFNLKIIDHRLAQSDPTDLMGFPNIVEGRSKYFPPETFPLEGDSLPKGKNGWLLFLDEINSAPPSVQAASYKLILDRAIGDKNLHEQVAIVCAGNLSSDKAIVNFMGTAMQSRLVHLEMQADHEGWVNWAVDHDIDYRIRAFIRFKPAMLHNFDPNHDDNTFPCP